MREHAYAKINLCLDVVGSRPDGYHELKMIMVPIRFYDVLEIELAGKTSLSLNRSYLPVDEKNTVLKAIACLRQHYGFSEQFACRLNKHIPSQAGLAGGSADAAAAIRLLNTLLHLQMDRPTMLKIAREVGADVPFCCLNQPALVSGIGEQIEPFECHPDFGLLLVKPRRGVSTKAAFDALAELPADHPDCLAMRQALVTNDYPGIIHALGNSLEAVSLHLVDEIRIIKEQLKEMGFDGVLMSGSGSTVFAISRNPQLLQEGSVRMHAKGYFVRVTEILKAGS